MRYGGKDEVRWMKDSGTPFNFNSMPARLVLALVTDVDVIHGP